VSGLSNVKAVCYSTYKKKKQCAILMGSIFNISSLFHVLTGKMVSFLMIMPFLVSLNYTGSIQDMQKRKREKNLTFSSWVGYSQISTQLSRNTYMIYLFCICNSCVFEQSAP
jgi:hypothetical protein